MFKGSLVAIVTPFDKKGRIDVKQLEHLVNWHISEGTEGIVCCGTTGEAPCLSELERKKIAQICIQTAEKRVPIIVGTGVSSTEMSIRNSEQMLKLGADGCLVVTPYYNKPMPRGCFLHFQEIAKVGLPVIVYHNPSRAVIRLSAEVIAEISQIPGVVALKDSSGDLELLRKTKSLCSLPILAGDDDRTFEILKEGGVGAISVIGNIIPRSWREMIRLTLSGNLESGEKMAQKYMSLCRALFLETNPQGIKFAMACLKLCQPNLRLPMILPTKLTQQAIKQSLLALALPQFKKLSSLSSY